MKKSSGYAREGGDDEEEEDDDDDEDEDEDEDDEDQKLAEKKSRLLEAVYENQFYADSVAQMFSEQMGKMPKHGKKDKDEEDDFSGGSDSASSSDSSSDDDVWVDAQNYHPEDPFFCANQVACGGQHSLLLDKNGRVWSWGNNEYGQLGRKRAMPRLQGVNECVHRRQVFCWHPHLSAVQKPVVIGKIACGDRHCLAVGYGGKMVFSWGCADNGRLGLSKTKGFVNRPKMITEKLDREEVIDVSCGSAHSAAVCTGEPGRLPKLYTWGKNDSGQCGVSKHHLAHLNKLLAQEKGDEKDIKFQPTPDVLTPELVEIEFPTEYSTSPPARTQRVQPAARSTADLNSPRSYKRASSMMVGGRKSMEYSMRSNRSGIHKSIDASRHSTRKSHEGSRQGAPSQRRVSSSGSSGASSSHASRVDVSKRSGFFGASRANITARFSASFFGASRANVTGRVGTSLFGASRADITKSSNFGDKEEEREPAPVMVACGACHTLALLGSGWSQPEDKRQESEEHPLLYLLGSGLDRQARVEDVWIKRLKKNKKQVLPEKAFLPRLIKYAFTDTAEISTQKPDKEDADEKWDPVIYTMKQVESEQNEDDPEAEKIVDQKHCFTFTFSGDLASIKACDLIAFTGPNAPPGLRLESAQDGPWFEVLGKDAEDEPANTEDDEKDKTDNKNEKGPGKTVQTWDDEMGPNRKPFYLHKMLVKMNSEKKQFCKPGRHPVDHRQNFSLVGKADCESVGVEDQGVEATLYKCEKVEEETVRAMGQPDPDGLWLYLYLKTSTIRNRPGEEYRRFAIGDTVEGKCSKAKAKVKARLEEVLDKDGNPDVIWHEAPQRFTVQVSDTVLTTECDSYEKVADWITQNVTTEDTKNMLVCMRADLPPLKQIASGSFHACALTAEGGVLMWGMGALGRLGLGNQLEQLIPTALEIERFTVDSLVLSKPSDDEDEPEGFDESAAGAEAPSSVVCSGIDVIARENNTNWQYIKGSRQTKTSSEVPVRGQWKSLAPDAKPEVRLLEVNMQRVDREPEEEEEEGGLEFAQKLLEGPENSTVVVTVAYAAVRPPTTDKPPDSAPDDSRDQAGQQDDVQVIVEMYKGPRCKNLGSESQDGDDEGGGG